MKSLLSFRLLGILLLLSVCLLGQENRLQQDFKNPPKSARPRVWWHWMNGNISRQGIKLDLEWMHRVGIAGYQNFDAALQTPQVVEKRLAYMTPEWKDAFKYAITTGDQLGMEMAIAGSPGWSETTVQAPPEWFREGSRLWIDLGDVKNLAEVTVNGKDLGQAWHAPYRVDATSALKPGANDIKIRVVNAWVNRMVGDEQPGATKFTFADVKPYKANSPLLPSGLLGPVTVVREDVP